MIIKIHTKIYIIILNIFKNDIDVDVDVLILRVDDSIIVILY